MRKESLGVIVAVSVWGALLPASIPTASAKSAAAEKQCIQLSHTGSHDKPIGNVQMCLGKKAKRTFQSPLENKWGFEFDAAAFARVRALVLHEKDQPPVSAGPLPLGTFTVSWREQGKVKDEDYTLEPAKSCPYLGQLGQTVSGKEYGEFLRVLQDLKSRVNCPAAPSN